MNAYHLQTQGPLGQISFKPKIIIWIYCLDKLKEAGEGIPFLIFAARESVQKMSMIHSVWNYIWTLGTWSVAINKGKVNIGWNKERTFVRLEWFRRRISEINTLAREHIRNIQCKRKEPYYKKNRYKILFVVPTNKHPLKAKFQVT